LNLGLLAVGLESDESRRTGHQLEEVPWVEDQKLGGVILPKIGELEFLCAAVTVGLEGVVVLTRIQTKTHAGRADVSNPPAQG